MKIDKKTLARWDKYCHLLCYELKIDMTKVKLGKAWKIAYALNIPAEAYLIDDSINDSHIETALIKIFKIKFKKEKTKMETSTNKELQELSEFSRRAESERAGKAAKIRQDLEGIAAIIGGAFENSGEDSDWMGRILFNDGKSLFFRFDFRAATYSVSPILPRDDSGRAVGSQDIHSILNGAEFTTNIKFSAKKTPAAMAGDIIRRLMPSYHRMWDAALQIVAGRNAYSNKITAAINRFTSLGIPAPYSKDSTTLHFASISSDDCYGEIQVMQDTVGMRLGGVPHDKAEAIFKILKGEA